MNFSMFLHKLLMYINILGGLRNLILLFSNNIYPQAKEKMDNGDMK